MKINFIKIEGEKFLSFKNTFLFNFIQDKSLTLIKGKTGSGKSSILESFVWCLFGKTLKQKTYEEEVISKKEDDCWVKLTFNDEEKIYEIIRKRSRSGNKKLELLINNDNLYSNSTDTFIQTKIEEILGLDFESFVNSIIFGQNYSGFPELKPSDRAKIFSKLQNIDNYLEKSNKANIKYTQMNLDIEAINNVEILILKEKILDLKKSIKNNDIVDFENKKLSIINNLNDQIKNNNEKIKSYNKLKENEQLNESIKKIKTEILQLNEEISKITYTDPIEIQKEISEIRREIDSEKNKKSLILDEIHRMNTLGVGKCVRCKNYITKEHLNSEIEVLKKDIIPQIDKIKNLNDKYDKLNEKFKIISNDNCKYNTIKNSILFKEKDLENLVSKKKLTELHNKEIINNLLNNNKNLKKEIENTKNQKNIFKEMWDNNKKEIVILIKKINELNNKIKNIKDLATYYKFWIDGFKKIRFLLFNQGLDYFEYLTKEYLQKYDTNLDIEFNTKRETKSGKTKDEFNIIVYNEDGPISYSLYSGGEKKKIQLSISLALSQIILEKCNRDFNIRMFDEPNNDLDDISKKINFKIFKELSNNKEVFVIDHDANFKDQFNNSITIIKNDMGSEIK